MPCRSIGCLADLHRATPEAHSFGTVRGDKKDVRRCIEY
jgi:hypothetical protein